MAYDPTDPADKKIVDKLIKDAVDSALSEAEAEHETAVTGLKKKNADLLKKIKEGGDGDPAEVAKLEEEIDALKAKVKDSDKAVKSLTKERDDLKTTAETEAKVSHNLLVENGLTEALVSNNVAKQFLPAVKAMLAPQVSIKTEGDARKAVIGEKSLGDFVKEWSQGDDGKHYIAAPSNGGGGAPGGQGSNGGKSMTRTAYEAMNASNPATAAAFFAEGGTLTEG